MRKIIIAGTAGAALAMAGALVVPAMAAGPEGCAAQSNANCTFVGDGSANAGYAAATSGSWSITHVDSTGATVTDASGSGPNGASFVFASGVTYTVTNGGTGVVGAGGQ